MKTNLVTRIILTLYLVISAVSCVGGPGYVQPYQHRTYYPEATRTAHVRFAEEDRMTINQVPHNRYSKKMEIGAAHNLDHTKGLDGIVDRETGKFYREDDAITLNVLRAVIGGGSVSWDMKRHVFRTSASVCQDHITVNEVVMACIYHNWLPYEPRGEGVKAGLPNLRALVIQKCQKMGVRPPQSS